MTRVEATARLSAKSQVVIPKEVRERLGIGPGDLLAFEVRGDEIVVRPVPRGQTEDPFALFTEWSSPADDEAYADF
jgi:antitoxin PrlF